MQPTRQGPLLTADEAAEYLAVSRRTVETWTAEGRLQSFHIGRVRRYTQAALDACIAEYSRAEVRRHRARRHASAMSGRVALTRIDGGAARP